MTADAYQFAGYGSWSNRNWFADLAVTGAIDNLKITRPGLITPLTASPDATAVVVQSKAGYLFDIATLGSGAFNASSVKLGPIAGFTYSHVHINAYAEIRRSHPQPVGRRVRSPMALPAVPVSKFGRLIC